MAEGLRTRVQFPPSPPIPSAARTAADSDYSNPLIMGVNGKSVFSALTIDPHRYKGLFYGPRTLIYKLLDFLETAAVTVERFFPVRQHMQQGRLEFHCDLFAIIRLNPYKQLATGRQRLFNPDTSATNAQVFQPALTDSPLIASIICHLSIDIDAWIDASFY